MKLHNIVILLNVCLCTSSLSAQVIIEKPYPNRLYFSIDSTTQRIIVPVHFNDSIVADLMFDTGSNDASLLLDSAFFFTHRFLPNIQPDKASGNFPLIGISVQKLLYHTNIPVTIGKTVANYDSLSVQNLQNILGIVPANGLFNIPTSDSIHVWELNFENNYLEVHSAADFQMPAECILSPIVEAYLAKYCIQIPLQIICGNDTLQSNDVYIIDTGNPFFDIISAPPSTVIDFLNRFDNDIWFAFGTNGIQRDIVQAIAWNDVAIDTLKFYTFYQGYGFKLVGCNFLKHFNVFFDMSKKQIGLQPIKYNRLAMPPYYSKVFHYSADSQSTEIDNYKINSIGDYKTNQYKTAGLQMGDEIVSVNGILYKDYKKTQTGEIEYSDIPAQSDFLTFEIIREGKRMVIKVPNIRR
jgi:hypothetical protein